MSITREANARVANLTEQQQPLFIHHRFIFDQSKKEFIKMYSKRFEYAYNFILKDIRFKYPTSYLYEDVPFPVDLKPVFKLNRLSDQKIYSDEFINCNLSCGQDTANTLYDNGSFKETAPLTPQIINMPFRNGDVVNIELRVNNVTPYLVVYPIDMVIHGILVPKQSLSVWGD